MRFFVVVSWICIRPYIFCYHIPYVWAPYRQDIVVQNVQLHEIIHVFHNFRNPDAGKMITTKLNTKIKPKSTQAQRKREKNSRNQFVNYGLVNTHSLLDEKKKFHQHTHLERAQFHCAAKSCQAGLEHGRIFNFLYFAFFYCCWRKWHLRIDRLTCLFPLKWCVWCAFGIQTLPQSDYTTRNALLLFSQSRLWRLAFCRAPRPK